MTMNLNPQQQEAVEHVDGPLLVLAGPGSGKTRVLVHRIARLIERGAAYPSQILAVTFTNKAADEMRRRIESLIGPVARELTAGTFHSVCLRWLRKNSEVVGLGPDFLVYDDADQKALIRECLVALNIDSERFTPQSALERISRAKDACAGPLEFAATAKGNPYLERVARVYERYQARLGELGAADFGDLIRLAVKLFEENPELIEFHRRRWKYILVDEYQDTNHAQYRLIRHLVAATGNLCVVGDDEQAIYRWRGADISNILRFEKDFPGATVVKLEQNYRSTKTIIGAASSVVANNAGRKPKSIWTDNAEGSKITVLTCESERREAESVARKISSACTGTRKFGDIAIFYRINAQSRPFEDAFRVEGIPYRIFGGMRFYERAEVKDVLAYLKLIVRPEDDISFKRVVNVPARGIGKTTIERLELFARERGLSLLSAVSQTGSSDVIRNAAIKKLVAFGGMMETLRAGSQTLELEAVVRAVLDKSGYIESLATVSSIESEAKLENINELLTAAAEFRPSGETSPTAEFLDQVALVSGSDDIDEEKGFVTMMTLHLAKGLEYPQVFMVGMEEGLFPHARSQDDPDELEEERRLCYVGMTRAKEELTLTHAFLRRVFGAEKYNVASRFLNEIPGEYVSRSRVAVQTKTLRGGVSPKRTSFGSDFDFDQRPAEEQAAGFAKGARVRHPTFGVGTVASCERTSSGHKVTVHFASGDVKRLIAEFAGLAIM
ncbi:MAG: UvrD-helicase domain-containing protein [Pseudomonadota bacterium]